MTSARSDDRVERRSNTRATIDRMLAERQEMLVLYEQVAGVPPYDGSAPDPDLLARFSQILVDYVAAGHFGLYERIAQGRERRRAVVDVAGRVYARIAETTDAVVAFNDAYDRARAEGEPGAVKDLLPRLGEALAARIELEDQVLAHLLDRE